MLSEINQIQKDKYCVISLICGILKKKKVELLETESRTVLTRMEGIKKCWSTGKKSHFLRLMSRYLIYRHDRQI